MAKKKTAKRTVKAKPKKVTKKKVAKKAKANVSIPKTLLPQMLQPIKPKIRELNGTFTAICTIQIEGVCTAPTLATFAQEVKPINQFENLLNKSRFMGCRKCVSHKEKIGEWEVDWLKGRRIG